MQPGRGSQGGRPDQRAGRPGKAWQRLQQGRLLAGLAPTVRRARPRSRPRRRLGGGEVGRGRYRRAGGAPWPRLGASPLVVLRRLCARRGSDRMHGDCQTTTEATRGFGAPGGGGGGGSGRGTLTGRSGLSSFGALTTSEPDRGDADVRGVSTSVSEPDGAFNRSTGDGGVAAGRPLGRAPLGARVVRRRGRARSRGRQALREPSGLAGGRPPLGSRSWCTASWFRSASSS